MTRLLRRLRYLLQRDRHERELDDELQFHLEMKQQELEASGVDRATAAATARRTLGNLPLTRDDVRDVWIAPWLRSVAQDVRFAGRLLLKERGFTLAVLVVLGVGMALTGAMYTVLNAAMFGSLPGDDGERIVSLGTRDARGRTAGLSVPDFEDWRDGNETFDGMAAMFGTSLNVSDDEIAPEMVVGAYVSHDALRLLRTPPLLRRDFLPEDDVDGAPGTAILSHGLWMSRYGGDPDVIGGTIRVNDRPSVLIGVMPEGFAFPVATAVWAPIGPTFGGSERGRDARTHRAFGRLADGVSLQRAQADLDVVAARLAERYPETNAGIRPTAVPFTEQLLPDGEKRLLLALLGGVVLVLLIACANVANLLLSRSARRAREMSLRVSLGATRWRLVRQLLMETVLLAGTAGLAGVALTGLAVRLVTTQLGGAPPYWVEYTMDGRVLALVAATCLTSGLACGVAPALHVSKTHVNDRLKDGSRTGSGAAGFRARQWTIGLLTAEVALTLMLLAGAGLMVRSFLALHRDSLVVNASGLTTMGVRLSSARYPTPEERRAFYEEVEARLTGLAGVDAFTLASVNPLGSGYVRSLAIDGRPGEVSVESPRVTYVTVGPDYFSTLGLPLLRGRAFTWLDGTAGHENAVVNERFAAMFFPDSDPIGQRIRLTNPNVIAEELPWLTVVGVSPTVCQMARTGAPDRVVYYPFRGDSGFFVRLIVRSSGNGN
ncbi:MAG: ABC transporter permease [Acidobacteria bacterium]|nr:ABC transporter permease [Acidobacteriota bacterium]